MLEIFNTIVENKEILWGVEMFLIIFFSLILSFITGIIISRFEKKLTKNKVVWDDLFLRAIRKPIKILIWVFGIFFAGKVTGQYINSNLSDTIYLIRNLGIIFVVSWFLWNMIKEYELHLTNDERVDTTTVIAITKLLKATIFITSGLMVLQTLGMNIGGIIAFGGVGGVVIGFAAKDLLANFFGSLMVYLDRPFLVGEWIRSPDKEIEGTVEYIGWRLTHIRTFDSRLLYVPNSVFSTISIENPSRMKNRRINETIGVRYSDVANVSKIIEEVREMLNNNQEIEQKQTLMVFLDKFNEYSIDFFIYCFTRTREWAKYHEVKQDVLLKISDIIVKNGGEIAFPTSVVNIENLEVLKK